MHREQKASSLEEKKTKTFVRRLERREERGQRTERGQKERGQKERGQRERERQRDRERETDRETDKERERAR